jgi:hypothetical protein
MSALNHYARTLRLAGIVNALKDAGLDVEIGTDFLRYRRIRKPQMAKRPIYPMFDIGASYVDASNGFWIVAYNEEGALVHTQACRLLPLGEMTLAEHLREHRLKYVTPGLVPDPEEASYHLDHRISETIRGKVCYQGEFWLSAEWRGTGAIALLSRLPLELAEMTWQPDFVFAFVDASNALSGTPARHGYFHAAPGTWQTRDGAVFAREWLIWMAAGDIAALMAAPFDANYRLLETAAQARGRRAGDAEVHHVQPPRAVPVG